MRAGSDPASFAEAMIRLPRWVLGLAAVGTAVTGAFCGLSMAGGFLVGALGAWLNLRVIERAASRIGRAGSGKPGGGTGPWIFLQFAGLIFGAFVIMRYSGFNASAAFAGFLICPAAVVLEIVYELVTLNFQK